MKRTPALVGPTLGSAAAITAPTVVASGLLVHRRLDDLDLVAVLKNRVSEVTAEPMIASAGAVTPLRSQAMSHC